MNAAFDTQVAALSCISLSIAVARRSLVNELSLSLHAGTVTCILGCNGAGKTLTLHTLAGVRTVQSGRVAYAGRELPNWPRKDLAREVGLLVQSSDDPFPSTVIETVLIGRHPHIGFWQWEGKDDKAIARRALDAVGLANFEDRNIASLSGGERRRVEIAALLAQDPSVLLLDEPTNHLDPHHQIAVLNVLRRRAENGRTILMSLHDVGLAARFADQALLLFGNGEWLFGPVADTLTEETISRLYGMRMREIAWPGGRTFAAGE